MNPRHRVIITCGPSYEPLDQVRRLTNSSTGALGMMLAGSLVNEGYQVICFKGEGATTKAEPFGVQIIEFTTNDHLHRLLQEIPGRESILAFFHAAALCDFKIEAIRTRDDKEINGGKISSRAGELHLTLSPALKVISLLRSLFPTTIIFGWKYEVEGSASDSVSKGVSQIANNGINACVVNGPAYGEGFGYLLKSGELSHIKDRAGLCAFLVAQLDSLTTANNRRI